MITKRQIILLLLAILCSIGAFLVLRWSQQINHKIENPDFFEQIPTTSDVQITVPTNDETIQFLVSDFEDLLSEETLSSLYQ
ncbi:MAG: hypothetical protein Q4B28_06410 [bacterium]|nr:hypothetical protein [bacterium]